MECGGVGRGRVGLHGVGSCTRVCLCVWWGWGGGGEGSCEVGSDWAGGGLGAEGETVGDGEEVRDGGVQWAEMERIGRESVVG